MRIALYTDTFFPSINGVSTSVEALAQALAQDGHLVFIQAPKPKIPVEITWLHPNITVNFVRAVDAMIYPDFRLAANLPLSLQAIKQFQPDLIHIHTPLSVGIEGVLTAKALKIPVMQTFHTYYMDEQTFKTANIHNKHLVGILKKGGWKFQKVFSGLTNATTAPTKFVLKDLRSHGVPEPLIYCPNLVPDHYFAKHPRHPKFARRLLFVGRVSHEKRIHVLLAALAQARHDIPDLELHIIGDGPARNQLFDLSVDLGISQNIVWYGKIPHDQLIREHHYHTGDLFVTASNYETFGYTTLEAMAHELPVVAPASRANKEVIGKTGFLVADSHDEAEVTSNLAAAIIKACHTELIPMRKATYQRAEEFRPANALQYYLKAYEKILKQSG